MTAHHWCQQELRAGRYIAPNCRPGKAETSTCSRASHKTSCFLLKNSGKTQVFQLQIPQKARKTEELVGRCYTQKLDLQSLSLTLYSEMIIPPALPQRTRSWERSKTIDFGLQIAESRMKASLQKGNLGESLHPEQGKSQVFLHLGWQKIGSKVEDQS